MSALKEVGAPVSVQLAVEVLAEALPDLGPEARALVLYEVLAQANITLAIHAPDGPFREYETAHCGFGHNRITSGQRLDIYPNTPRG